MGARTSSVFSEMYLQSIENTAIYDILVKKPTLLDISDMLTISSSYITKPLPI